jgi:hypothetical protein
MFAGGQYIIWRHALPIPKGSTIQDATLRVNVLAKNNGAAQTCYNSVRAHISGDSPILVPGTGGIAQRPWTAARVEFPMTWVPNPPDAVYMTINVKPIIDEIMALPDYKSEGYITFMMYTDNENGSDMGIRANNGFFIGPQLDVNFTEPSPLKTTFNHHENPVLDPTINSVAVADGGRVGGFYEQSEFFGGFVPPANQGTIAVDTSFVHTAGIPTLRFTCGTKATDLNQRTGWSYPFRIEAAKPCIFTCWLYISSAIPANSGRVEMGDVFVSMANVGARGQWVPFSTPVMNTAGQGTRWWTIGVKDYQPGWQFWMSEPAIIHTNFKQMPFIGATPTKLNDIYHRASVSKQMSVREWVPKRNAWVNGVLKNYPSWTIRSDGILVLSEPVKGGVTSLGMPAQTAVSLPAGLTISEL